MLHYFFTRATEVVEAHGGELQEFRGDGILALWQTANSRAAEQALAAASALNAALDRSLLPGPSSQGLEPLALGVSIEQGPVLLGSIGPAHRRTHTPGAISDVRAGTAEGRTDDEDHIRISIPRTPAAAPVAERGSSPVCGQRGMHAGQGSARRRSRLAQSSQAPPWPQGK